MGEEIERKDTNATFDLPDTFFYDFFTLYDCAYNYNYNMV